MTSSDPTVAEMRAFLRSSYSEADDTDIECAIYWFANDWHDGPGSNLYSALSTSEYHPGCSENAPEPDSFAADMYSDLEQEYAQC